jgi:hypothetical protein
MNEEAITVTCTGREPLSARLARLIEVKRRELAGLEQLAKIASHIEADSPGEGLLWEMLSAYRNRM